jgi:hypothetical protein
MHFECHRCQWFAIGNAGFAHNFNWCRNFNCCQTTQCKCKFFNSVRFRVLVQRCHACHNSDHLEGQSVNSRWRTLSMSRWSSGLRLLLNSQIIFEHYHFPRVSDGARRSPSQDQFWVWPFSPLTIVAMAVEATIVSPDRIDMPNTTFQV